MTPEQIVVFIFAALTGAFAIYLAIENKKWIAGSVFFFAIVLVIIGGIDPSTIKNLTLGKGKFKVERYEYTASQRKETIMLVDDERVKGISHEPLVEAAKQRAEQKKSAEDYLLLSTDAWKNKRYEEGLQYAYAGLALKQKDVRIQAILQHRIASIFEGMGAIKQAIAGYSKAIQTDPTFSWSHNNLGNIYKQQGKFVEAEIEYKKAIELDPKDPHMYNNLAVLYKAQGKYEQAEIWFRKAIDLDSSYVNGYYNLGNLYQIQDKFAEAEASYRKAIEFYPGFVDAHINLGIAYEAQDKFAEAEASYRKALIFDPEDEMARSKLDELLARKNK